MKVHRQHSQKESEEPAHSLYTAIAAIKSTEEAEKFLKDLCTPTELQAFADRWRVVVALKQMKPYRQIYDELGVSVTTVGRVARCLLLGEGGYNLIYERVKKIHDKLTQTKNSLTKKRSPT